MRIPSLLLSLAVALGAAVMPDPVQAQAPPPVPVKDFDIFIDLPTGFVFLKLPAAWKFVGKLDEKDLHALPAGVITSLLPPDPADAPLAQVDAPRRQ